MSTNIVCAKHSKQVTIVPGNIHLCHKGHQDYCDSDQFTTETLTRSQAMALLLISLGQEVIARGSK